MFGLIKKFKNIFKKLEINDVDELIVSFVTKTIIEDRLYHIEIENFIDSMVELIKKSHQNKKFSKNVIRMRLYKIAKKVIEGKYDSDMYITKLSKYLKSNKNINIQDRLEEISILFYRNYNFSKANAKVNYLINNIYEKQEDIILIINEINDNMRLKELLNKDITYKNNISSKYTIIGIGGGGINIIEELCMLEVGTYNTLAINSDRNDLNKSTINHYKLYLDKEDGYGCGGNEKCGFKLVDNYAQEQINSFCKDEETIYITATLGGGVGIGSTEAIINHLLSIKKEVVAFMVLPFAWEGKRKKDKVISMLKRIPTHNYMLRVCILHNQDLLENYQDKTMSECFSIINKTVNKMILDKSYVMMSNIINIKFKNKSPMIEEIISIKDLE